MASNNIHNAVQMKPGTFFHYSVGPTTTVVVRDGLNTKVHKSVGFPNELISLLDLRGFRRTSFEKKNA